MCVRHDRITLSSVGVNRISLGQVGFNLTAGVFALVNAAVEAKGEVSWLTGSSWRRLSV